MAMTDWLVEMMRTELEERERRGMRDNQFVARLVVSDRVEWWAKKCACEGFKGGQELTERE